MHAESLREIRKRNNLHCSFFPTQGTHNYFSYYRDYLHPVENFLSSHVKSKLPSLSDPLPVGKSPTHSRIVPSFALDLSGGF